MSLEGSAVEILSGLAAFRPVPSVGEWVLCLLLLWDGESGVGDGGKMCVCYVESVGGLDGGGSELVGGGSLFDEEKIE